MTVTKREGTEMSRWSMIGVPSSAGAHHAGQERAPDALRRYSSSCERRLQELAGADSDESPTEVTPVQAWTIGQAMLVGLQIYKRLAPGLVTSEVFERAFGLLANLYQEQERL